MSNPVFSRIEADVRDNSVMLYMKGTPVFPQCGFSATVASIMNAIGVEYHSVDVLQDPEVREGIKQYSDWPTIPQLYVKGEFIGGCDTTMEMYKSGELRTMLQEAGAVEKK